MVSPFEVIEGLNSIKSDKPILQVVMPLPEFWKKYRSESVFNTPLFRSPEDPVEVLSNMIFYSKNKIKKRRLHPKKSIPRNYSEGFLSQHDVEELLAEV